MRPAGRGLDKDHPDNLRMEEAAIAALRREDRQQAALESFGMSQGSAEALTTKDRYEPCDDAYARMEQERKNGHPNEWAR
jgi:hypothetical protein